MPKYIGSKATTPYSIRFAAIRNSIRRLLRSIELQYEPCCGVNVDAPHGELLSGGCVQIGALDSKGIVGAWFSAGELRPDVGAVLVE